MTLKTYLNSLKSYHEEYNSEFFKKFSDIPELHPKSGYIETNKNGDILSASENLIPFLGYTKENLITLNIKNLIFNNPSDIEAFIFTKHDEIEKHTFNVFLKTKSNDFFPAKINFVKKEMDKPFYTILVTQINNECFCDKTMDNPTKKDAIIQAIIFASEKVIQSSEKIDESILEEIIRHIGISTRSSRILILKNTKNRLGSYSMSLEYQWYSQNLFPVKKTAASKKYRYSKKLFNFLSQGNIFQKKVDEIQGEETISFDDHLIKSFIMFPIFSGIHFYGTLVLADCEKSRTWGISEKEGLFTSTRLIGQIITKLKAQNSLTKYNKELNSKNAPTCVTDSKFRTIFVSTGFQNFAGYSSAEILNIPLYVFLKPVNETLDDIKREINLSHGPILNKSFKLRTSPKSWVDVKADFTRLNTSSKEKLLIEISIRPKEAKKEEQDHPFYFTHIYDILEKIPAPVWVTDKNNHLVYSNSPFYKKILKTDKKEKEIIGKKLNEISPKLKYLVDSISKDIDLKKKIFLEKKNKDSKKIYRIHRNLLFNPDDEFEGIIWYAYDETKYIEKDNHIKSIEKKYTTILDNFPGAVFLKDSQGQYIYQNAYMQDKFTRHSIDPENIQFSKELSSKFIMEDLKVLKEGRIETTEVLQNYENRRFKFKKIKFPISLNGEESVIAGIAMELTEDEEQNQYQDNETDSLKVPATLLNKD